MFGKSKISPNVTVIGIWLHEIYPEGFTGEGISRLLVWIMRAAQTRADIHIKVACVSWVKEPFKRHLTDLGVDISDLEFITIPGLMPMLYGIYRWREERAKRPKTPRKWLIPWRTFKKWVTASFSAIIALPVLFSLPLILIFGILAAPFLFIWLIAKVIGYAARWMQNKINFIRTAYQSLKRAIRGRIQAEGPTKTERPFFTQAASRKPFQAYIEIMARRVYHGLINLEFEALARKSSRDKKIHGWFLAYPRNPYVSRFTVPIIQAVPDIVYMDFPTPFADAIPGLLESHDQIVETVRQAQSVITYSDFVRVQQVITPGYQPADRVHVVRHAPISTRELLLKDEKNSLIEIKGLAANKIQEYLKKLHHSNDSRVQYVKELSFGDFDYLFVSSQTRPHKNHLNLIKVYEKLLREKYFNIKLIFTGTFTPDMEEYIWNRKLHLDVLSIPHLPAMTHAAFYACAKLTIAPTLFEGGFPFVFSESLSVNVPALLSNIPVVQEMLTMEQRKTICFDPYDVDDMVRSIAWGLEHHNELLTIEYEIYEEMKKRTWDTVASEYIDVFKSTIAGAGK